MSLFFYRGKKAYFCVNKRMLCKMQKISNITPFLSIFLFTRRVITDRIFKRVEIYSAPCQLWPYSPKGGVDMRTYEVMYIIKASLEEEKRTALIETISGIITKEGGKIVKTDEWGMRDFAYEIDDMTKGYYVVTLFEAENECLKEFDRLMRINPNVVRFMTVSRDDLSSKESK